MKSRSAGIAAELGLVRTSAFRLLDVGVSGGLDPAWERIMPGLHAVGVDPLVAEIDRLSRGAISPNHRFIAAFAGDRASALAPDAVQQRLYKATSASWFTELREYDYVRTHFNGGAPVEFATQWISLDDLHHGHGPFHFIKVDTDGADLAVLNSGLEALRSPELLGVQVEVQFHGEPTETSNTLANIDVLLRAAGFVLHDLTTNRYSRSALPARFRYPIPAQTVRGQVMWGDALYFRDPLRDSSAEVDPEALESVLLLAILMEAFGLPDNAAELIANLPPRLLLDDHRTRLLDALAGRRGGYEGRVRRLRRAPDRLLPGRVRSLLRHVLESAIGSRWF